MRGSEVQVLFSAPVFLVKNQQLVKIVVDFVFITPFHFSTYFQPLDQNYLPICINESPTEMIGCVRYITILGLFQVELHNNK